MGVFFIAAAFVVVLFAFVAVGAMVATATSGRR